MKSIWYLDSDMPKFPQLKGDIKTDVLIIGGGITGILTAYLLKQKGVNYILVEKDRICSKTTGNTTAKITVQHGLIFDKLLNTFGKEQTKLYLEANQAAFDMYANLCAYIDCDYEIKDNYVYSKNDRAKLEKEMEALDKIGYKAQLCENTPLPLPTVGSIRFPAQAQFNPLKFLSAVSKDLNIYENTFVRDMIGNTAVTDYGKIYADKIIVATHFPFINKHGSYSLKLYQHRSYAIAFDNAQNVDGMYVDDDKKGMSFRNYKDYLIIGGGGHRTGKKGGGWQEIRNFASMHYPDSEEICRWAAQDCMSLDGMYYIGAYSKLTDKLYTASGFNKWGMTGAMLSAMILSDIIAERKNDYADLFSPSRSILRPQLALNGIETISNLLTFTNKRCTHLGCALKWNSAEHTWDCPCHGSRFSDRGEVIENPANKNIDNINK
ncbi:MAG: FAD-dependent oxidoreductase [Clostridium sp.]|nr:FAD-dependent oxidoreductase [Clostridium sp.]